jgi:hypothetical protein
VKAGGARSGVLLEKAALDWVGFATAHPHWYRLAFGEGFRGSLCFRTVRRRWTHSARGAVHLAQKAGLMVAADPETCGSVSFAAIHGLAHARADGDVPAELVAPMIRLWLDHFERGDQAGSARGRRAGVRAG